MCILLAFIHYLYVSVFAATVNLCHSIYLWNTNPVRGIQSPRLLAAWFNQWKWAETTSGNVCVWLQNSISGRHITHTHHSHTEHKRNTHTNNTLSASPQLTKLSCAKKNNNNNRKYTFAYEEDVASWVYDDYAMKWGQPETHSAINQSKRAPCFAACFYYHQWAGKWDRSGFWFSKVLVPPGGGPLEQRRPQLESHHHPA